MGSFPLISFGYASAEHIHLSRQVSIRFWVSGTTKYDITDRLSLSESHRRLVDLFTCHMAGSCPWLFCFYIITRFLCSTDETKSHKAVTKRLRVIRGKLRSFPPVV